MKTLKLTAAAALAACTFSSTVLAQGAYPSRPIRFIVPFPPGGGTDILARLVANKLTEGLGWQIVVDNRGGAGGNIGLDAAAKAAPDGYTMVMGQTSNLAINPALYSKLPYDPVKHFTPVSLVASSPIAITVAGKSPHKTLGDLVAAAKAKPGEITFGSPGNGTVAHLTGEMFQRAAAIKYIHVPYKGAAQAMPDLIGGRISFYTSSLETAMPQMKAGAIRTVGITSLQRVTAVPDVPTVSESGFKGFEATTWFGVLVAKGTPAPIVDRLSNEIVKVLNAPDIRQRMADNGGATVKAGPAEFDKFLKAEIAKWGRIVKDSGVRID